MGRRRAGLRLSCSAGVNVAACQGSICVTAGCQRTLGCASMIPQLSTLVSMLLSQQGGNMEPHFYPRPNCSGASLKRYRKHAQLSEGDNDNLSAWRVHIQEEKEHNHYVTDCPEVLGPKEGLFPFLAMFLLGKCLAGLSV